jgi:hypothetical protein
MNDNKIRRPVRWTDFLVVFTETLFNLSQVIETLFESLYELSIYHSNRTTETHKAWEQMAQDLETIQEETDGR